LKEYNSFVQDIKRIITRRKQKAIIYLADPLATEHVAYYEKQIDSAEEMLNRVVVSRAKCKKLLKTAKRLLQEGNNFSEDDID
jgi:hypothetical protein